MPRLTTGQAPGETRPQFRPAITESCGPGTSTGSPASMEASAQAAVVGSTPMMRAPAKRRTMAAGERSDADLHRHHVGLDVDLGADRPVALHGPARHLVGPRVLDDERSGLGRALDRVVVRPVDDLDAGALRGDRLAPGGDHVRRHEDRGLEAALARHAGDRAAVVAVGRAGEPRAVAAGLERAVDRPRRAEDLERGQPQPARLVLDPHAGDAERLGGGARVHERRRRIAGQRAMEAVGVGRPLARPGRRAG